MSVRRVLLPRGRRMASSTAEPAASAAAPRQGDLRNYVLVTGAYWTDTLVDGAIRTLVLFYFDQLGYTPLQVASLFVFYEIAGIVTNLVGGWLAARLGLKITLFMGLALQVTALCMLGFAPPSLLVVPYVMVSQALSGVAKDLNKMSSKSAVKLVVPENDQSSLYRWVAILTGSKNALKGVGFFLGGLLLTLFGFQAAVLALALLVLIALVVTSTSMRGHLGRPNKTAKFKHMFSNNRAVNILAAARIFLFAARDVWFVVGLPFFLYSELGWSFWAVGILLAVWVIGYGGVQAAAPRFVRGQRPRARRRARRQNGSLAGVRRRCMPSRDGHRPRYEHRPDRHDRHRAGPVRGAVRNELGGSLLPDPRLRRQRQGGDERRLLLHGQRLRPPRRHRPLRTPLPMARPDRMPVGINRVPHRRRPAVAQPADRGSDRHPASAAVPGSLAGGMPARRKDPQGRPVDEVRATRDEIARRVQQLLAELEASS